MDASNQLSRWKSNGPRPVRQQRQGQMKRQRDCHFYSIDLWFLPCLLLALLLLPPLLIDQYDVGAVEAAHVSSSSTRKAAFTTTSNVSPGRRRPNFLVIVCDQLRYDALGFVQSRMSNYDNKVKVKTPNLDRLASLGISFEAAYTTSPSCGPARASLKTGCTVARTGLVSNQMARDTNLTRQVPIFKQRLDRLVSYEQVFTQYLNYSVESYGKWHTDPSLFYTKTTPIRKAVQYTSYDWHTNTPEFVPVQTIKPVYQQSLQYLLERDGVNAYPRLGQLLNKMSGQGYDPLPIDTSYDVASANLRRFPDTTTVSSTRYAQERPIRKPSTSNTAAQDNGDDDDDNEGDGGDSTTAGRDALGPSYTTTAIVGQISVLALERNVQAYQMKQQPFLLSVHFNAPHPPVIGTGVYFDYYYANRNNLAIPASILDRMTNSAYPYSNQRKFLRSVPPSYRDDPALMANASDPNQYYPFMDKDRIAELTAAYYSTIEEVDAWVGRLVSRLEQLNAMSSTRIIFTSDHGDLLGAHGMAGKGVLLEEAARVPLILYAPSTSGTNGWEGGRVLKRPVSHLSLYATLLDYAGASLYDTSDGTSLRSFVERRSYNANYDDDVVVVELNGRRPLSATALFGVLGGNPSFMVRKGNYKLLIPRTSGSRVVDMMYHLTQDPWEMNNVLGPLGAAASDVVIGKAEHLKALLVEWMQRNDGPYKYYSDPVYNMNEGMGDLQEVQTRRTWRRVPLWISDVALKFGQPVRVVATSTSPSLSPNLFATSQSSSWDRIKFIRNEYLYVGRTLDGEALLRFDIQGADALRFSVFPNQARIGPNDYVKVKVSYVSGSNFGTNTSDTDAGVRIRITMDGSTTHRTIPIVCVQDNLEEETLAVRPTLRNNRIVEQDHKKKKPERGRTSTVAWAVMAPLTLAAIVGAVFAWVRRRRRHGLAIPALFRTRSARFLHREERRRGNSKSSASDQESSRDELSVPCDNSSSSPSNTSDDEEDENFHE